MRLSDKERVYIALSNASGIGAVKAKKIIETVGETDLLDYGIEKYKNHLIGIIGEKDFNSILKTVHGTDFTKLEKDLERKGITLLIRDDKRYPFALRCYDDAPLCLYTIGNTRLLNVPSFAVIGTRFPTKYGFRVTEMFVSKLCEKFCIVSGMARGIDACAHQTALECNGQTVAVLGCGVDIVYPAENRNIYEKIAEQGIIVSEYMPGTGVSAFNFPARNKIISGLSRALLITEAGESSGTMLTKKYAIEQGKAVYCVPGSIFNRASVGCNRTIRDCQTRMVLDVNDIYDDMGIKITESENISSSMQLDVNEERIVNALTTNGEMHFEEILNVVDLTVPQLSSLLMKMTALGIITKPKNNYWSI